MEAKDTVMTGKQIDAEMDRIEKLDTSYTTAEFELCKAQAEISFKAGEKKVVEWANETCPHDLGEGTQNFKRVCDLCWQEFLKSEGIE